MTWYLTHGWVTRPRSINFMTRLRLTLGYKALAFVLTTNLVLGPRFTQICWKDYQNLDLRLKNLKKIDKELMVRLMGSEYWTPLFGIQVSWWKRRKNMLLLLFITNVGVVYLNQNFIINLCWKPAVHDLSHLLSNTKTPITRSVHCKFNMLTVAFTRTQIPIWNKPKQD